MLFSYALLITDALPLIESKWQRVLCALILSAGAMYVLGTIASQIAAAKSEVQQGQQDTNNRLDNLINNVAALWKRINAIVSLGESLEKAQLLRRLEKLEKGVTALTDMHPPVWIMGLHGSRAEQAQTLERIKNLITPLLTGSKPGPELDDQRLKAIFTEVTKSDVIGSRYEEIRSLAYGVRDLGYSLSEEDFSSTRTYLRTSAETILWQYTGAHLVYPFRELMLHADDWVFAHLKELEERLREVRESIGCGQKYDGKFEDDHRKGLGCGLTNGGQRLWKRVWPNRRGNWGTIICDTGGHRACGCECVLEEVSLCGAYCNACISNPISEAFRVQLRLGDLVIDVSKARFRPHGSKQPGEQGVGIEFLEMSSADAHKLADFIRQNSELDPHHRPKNAPGNGHAH